MSRPNTWLREAWNSGLFWALLTLLFWAALLAYIHFSGRIVSFLHPTFRPLVPATSIVLFIMVIGLVVLPKREGEDVDPCCPGCGRVASPSLFRRMLSFWLLVLPALVAAWVAPHTYSLQTILNRGILKEGEIIRSLARSPLAAKLALPDAPLDGTWMPTQEEDDAQSLPGFLDFLEAEEDGALRIEVLDVLFLAEDPRLRPIIENLRVSILGQWITPRQQPSSQTGHSLVRLIMICCAADARPVGMYIDARNTQGATDIPEMSWVRARGVVRYEMIAGRRLAFLNADTIEIVPPPTEFFLF